MCHQYKQHCWAATTETHRLAMLIVLGLAAVLLLLLVPLLRVVFSLARGLLAREGGKAREQYYRVEGAREQDSLTDRLAVEYFEGGGFSVQGVVVAPGCHVILSLMAALFLSGGLLLSLTWVLLNLQVRFAFDMK